MLLADKNNALNIHLSSTGERKMLTTAKQILLSELVLATNESYEALERTLEAGL